jgi:hypothetical protein
MSDDRPPVTDAEYRVVRGPWPRWAYRTSLLSLALHTAVIVFICITIAVAIALIVRFR